MRRSKKRFILTKFGKIRGRYLINWNISICPAPIDAIKLLLEIQQSIWSRYNTRKDRHRKYKKQITSSYKQIHFINRLQPFSINETKFYNRKRLGQ